VFGSYGQVELKIAFDFFDFGLDSTFGICAWCCALTQWPVSKLAAVSCSRHATCAQVLAPLAAHAVSTGVLVYMVDGR
jgi:hypothetical protein